MSIQVRISRKRKITEIALTEAIRGWSPPASGPLHCPSCQSDRVVRRMQRKQGMTYLCKDCSKSFSEELLRQCRCVRPGKFTKCLSCPQYQRIRELMKANIEQLRDLSETEVDQILGHPDFYKNHFSLQQLLPQVEMEHYADYLMVDRPNVIEAPIQPIANGNSEQLSLFE